MILIKRVELDNIGFDVGTDPVKQGQIALRWRKMTIIDGKVEATEPHRDLIDVDTDLNARLEEVYADLERQGFGRPPDTDRGYIDDATKRAWTPEVRAAVKADRKAKAEREEAERAENEKQAKKANEEQQAADEARFAEWASRNGLKSK